MPAYNFQKRFADAVASGAKCCTIRRSHKNAKPGDTAYLFTDQRTRACRRLGAGEITSVIPIVITESIDSMPLIALGGIPLTLREKAELARAEGFADVADMSAWFLNRYGDHFSGWLHRWRLV